MVEHVSDDVFDKIFIEVNRVLKDNGILFITTPNNEDLSASIQVCPDCGCYFHSVGHVRSWNKYSLREKLSSYGFEKYKVLETTFFSDTNSLKKKIIRKIYIPISKIYGREQKNLVYVAKKKTDIIK